MPDAPQEEKAEIPEWVVTFGDMMSLLLTFFIMLFSMSEMKEDQLYQAYMDALNKQFGYDKATMASVPGDAQPKNSILAKLASLGRAMRAHTMRGGNKVKAPVGEHPRVSAISLSHNPARGCVIVFEKDSAALTDAHKQKLRVAAGQIGGKPQKVQIRGHTVKGPMAPGGPDHWDLAYNRCKSTMLFLVETGIDRRRIHFGVFADNEPQTTEPDPKRQAQNARVEVMVLPEYVSKAVAGDLATPAKGGSTPGEPPGAGKHPRVDNRGDPLRPTPSAPEKPGETAPDGNPESPR